MEMKAIEAIRTRKKPLRVTMCKCSLVDQSEKMKKNKKLFVNCPS